MCGVYGCHYISVRAEGLLRYALRPHFPLPVPFTVAEPKNGVPHLQGRTSRALMFIWYLFSSFLSSPGLKDSIISFSRVVFSCLVSRGPARCARAPRPRNALRPHFPFPVPLNVAEPKSGVPHLQGRDSALIWYLFSFSSSLVQKKKKKEEKLWI